MNLAWTPTKGQRFPAGAVCRNISRIFPPRGLGQMPPGKRWRWTWSAGRDGPKVFWGPGVGPASWPCEVTPAWTPRRVLRPACYQTSWYACNTVYSPAHPTHLPEALCSGLRPFSSVMCGCLWVWVWTYLAHLFSFFFVKKCLFGIFCAYLYFTRSYICSACFPPLLGPVWNFFQPF